MMNRTERTEAYYYAVISSQSETARKERLQTLLFEFFGGDEEIRDLLTEMALGAEKPLYKIAAPQRIRGFADTLYRNIIIEFERDMAKTANHARDQLSEYLSGVWRMGGDFNYVLIATDCITWQLYAPSYEDFMYKDELDAAQYQLRPTESFVLNETNFEDFYYFLDRALFRKEPIKATLHRVQLDFGERSQTLISAMGTLTAYYKEVKQLPDIITAKDQWASFLTLAYGSFEATDEVFLIHTYLSLLVKLMAYNFLSDKVWLSEEEILVVLNGKAFHTYNITNYVENDFYDWAAQPHHTKRLIPAIRKIMSRLSDYSFTNVNEDILKGVYQELVDIETRHALGEYYTPDWLCTMIIRHLNPQPYQPILDPSCGSGSFLRAAVAHLRKVAPELTPDELADSVTGIDVHPLSVQVAKTTVLLSIGKHALATSKRRVSLRIYLANTLLMPKDYIDLYGKTFSVKIDKKHYEIEAAAFDDTRLFDDVVSSCEMLAEYDKHKKTESIEDFTTIISNRHKTTFPKNLIENYYNIFIALKEAKENNRDGIWKFILQNNYKPFFLKGRFEFVVGNPPWLVFNSVTNSEYQEALRGLAHKYELTPRPALVSTLELAAIFMAHCSEWFLPESHSINEQTGPHMAFVLPRAFFTADQHENTRSGNAKGFRLSEIWDLEKVTPLFNVPSCVFFANRRPRAVVQVRYTELPGKTVKGRLPEHNLELEEAEPFLTVSETPFYYATLGKRTAFATQNIQSSKKTNYYAKHFKNGASLIPRNFYFIELAYAIPNYDDREVYCKSTNKLDAEAKMPWKQFKLDGFLNSNFFFRTALAKNLIPFALIDPIIITLPIKIMDDKSVKIMTPRELLLAGHEPTFEWYTKAEKIWDANKTQRNENITFFDYLNWQNKLTSQNLSKRYLVLYTGSAKDASAVIVDRETLDLPFIVESAAYWFSTNDPLEAFFLTSFLNSNFANLAIKPFQARGLFGPRHIQKKILEVPLPRYSESNPLHQKLAELGQTCTEKAAEYLQQNPPGELTGPQLGKLRATLRLLLASELEQIDKVLSEVCG